jgi:nitroreductase/NAD-dependent dihydropyrimidine dehydrogenase PreA subunit
MGILAIDETKCKLDGICAAECPRMLISFDKEQKTIPYIKEEKEPFCMACGHCVAVCPHGALSISGAPLEVSTEIDKSLTLSWEQAEQFLRSRRSIRLYKDQAVDQKTMQTLIKAASYAPTASNAQNVAWLVINGREKLRGYAQMTIDWMRGLIRDQPETPFAKYCVPTVANWDAGNDVILRGASTMVIASAPSANTNGLVDLSIALSYLELAAPPLGVGTCWAGLLRAAMVNSDEVLKSLGLPEDHTWFYPMMVGYPRVKYFRLPERKEPDITWR